nr:MAG TPA: hypothetical protein [Caudoviricetes sp.]
MTKFQQFISTIFLKNLKISPIFIVFLKNRTLNFILFIYSKFYFRLFLQTTKIKIELK